MHARLEQRDEGREKRDLCSVSYALQKCFRNSGSVSVGCSSRAATPYTRSAADRAKP